MNQNKHLINKNRKKSKGLIVYLIEIEKMCGEGYFKALLQSYDKNFVSEFESYKMSFNKN